MEIDPPVVLLVSALVEKRLNKRLADICTDKGIVIPKGRKGDKGEKGEPGLVGKQGLKGDPGEKGERGERGPAGREGPAGKDGKDGKDARGIDSIVMAPDGAVIARYSDGTSQNIGFAQVNNITHVSGGGGGLIPDHYIIHSVVVEGDKLILACNNNKRFEVTLPSGGGSSTNLAYDPATRVVSSSTGTDATLTLVDGTNAGLMTSADKTKLDAVESGATANSSDAALRDRSTHTGTQTSSTISDFSESVDDRVAGLLVAGSNITLNYNDVANTLTISSTGGGGGGTPTFETVSKNLDASDATVTYGLDGIEEISYSSGVIKTFSYGVNGLSTVVLSGATPGGIDLTKTFNYSLGELTGWTYS